jgi:hypothetical protein
MTKHPPKSLLLFLCAAPACSLGGQTGEDGGPLCVPHESAVAPDELTPIGMRASESPGVPSASIDTLIWWSGDDGTEVYDGTCTPAHLEFHASMESTRFVHEVAKNGPAAQHNCGDYLKLDGELTLRTSDGRFDDTWPATLQTSTPGEGTVWAQFDLAKLNGSYDFAKHAGKGQTETRGYADIILSGGTAAGFIQGFYNRQIGELSDYNLGGESGACSGGVARSTLNDACAFEVYDFCFLTSEAACTCAGCAADTCMILESRPAQIRCQ